MAMASMASELHTYRLNTSDSGASISHALELLRPHIPVSLPLYRRIQCGHFLDATALLSNITLGFESNGRPAPTSHETPANEPPWLIAFVDRSRRPETEVNLFASWESGSSPVPTEQQDAIDRLVEKLVKAMKDLDLPPSIHDREIQSIGTSTDDSNDTKDSVGLSRSDYDGHAGDPNIMLWGAIHERSVPILDRLGYLPRKFKTSVLPNHCFIWDVQSLHPHDELALPSDLRWGTLEREHFALVRSRTQIPRQDRTLAVLPNLGIFDEASGKPVAWAFVGLDASLTTLHVETEYRGKGLAKALTTKLFKEKMEKFWEKNVPNLSHGYVIDGNKESEGMCKSLGGVSKWQVYWLRVDLGEVR